MGKKLPEMSQFGKSQKGYDYATKPIATIA
jgi:hypothetical protein